MRWADVLLQAKTDAISINYPLFRAVVCQNTTKARFPTTGAGAGVIAWALPMMRLAALASKVHLSFEAAPARPNRSVEALP
jgi:hypothetical protein